MTTENDERESFGGHDSGGASNDLDGRSMGPVQRMSHSPDPGAGSPSASTDWRLLIPLANGSRILVGGVAAEEIASSLARVGANAAIWDEGRLTGEHTTSSWSRFDIVTVPLGFERGDVPAERTARTTLSSLRRLLKPGGTLLVGFDSPFGIRGSSSGRRGVSLRPARMVRTLEQTGYTSVRVYGVLGGLAMPRYILPLQSRVLEFVIHQQLRRRIPRLLVGLLAGPWPLAMLARAVPAYFATAVRAQ